MKFCEVGVYFLQKSLRSLSIISYYFNYKWNIDRIGCSWSSSGISMWTPPHPFSTTLILSLFAFLSPFALIFPLINRSLSMNLGSNFSLKLDSDTIMGWSGQSRYDTQSWKWEEAESFRRSFLYMVLLTTRSH